MTSPLDQNGDVGCSMQPYASDEVLEPCLILGDSFSSFLVLIVTGCFGHIH